MYQVFLVSSDETDQDGGWVKDGGAPYGAGIEKIFGGWAWAEIKHHHRFYLFHLQIFSHFFLWVFFFLACQMSGP